MIHVLRPRLHKVLIVAENSYAEEHSGDWPVYLWFPSWCSEFFLSGLVLPNGNCFTRMIFFVSQQKCRSVYMDTAMSVNDGASTSRRRGGGGVVELLVMPLMCTR